MHREYVPRFEYKQIIRTYLTRQAENTQNVNKNEIKIFLSFPDV